MTSQASIVLRIAAPQIVGDTLKKLAFGDDDFETDIGTLCLLAGMGWWYTQTRERYCKEQRADLDRLAAHCLAMFAAKAVEVSDHANEMFVAADDIPF